MRGLKGAGAARNVGILKAKFAYIAFLDGDDFT
ncbi:MAG: glycosyltransferase family 2 protein [Saprospiraceae bacterium]|nr:glycosyltransferase family 2 protein [Saprospiraceae bacterium]